MMKEQVMKKTSSYAPYCEWDAEVAFPCWKSCLFPLRKYNHIDWKIRCFFFTNILKIPENERNPESRRYWKDIPSESSD